MTEDGVSGLILAGGESRRFGSDKARFRVDGQPMIERVFDALQAVVTPVRISVGTRTQPFGLPAEHVPDEMPDAGPLGGLHAGLLRSEAPWLLVAACDLPFVTPETLQTLLDARDKAVDAVVAQTDDDRLHPHCACYHRRILPYVEQQLADRRLAFQAVLDRLPAVLPVRVPGRSLHNVNYRGDIDGAAP